MSLLPYKTNPNKTKRKNATRDYPSRGYWSGVQDSRRPAKPQVGDVKVKDASEKKKDKQIIPISQGLSLPATLWPVNFAYQSVAAHESCKSIF